MRRFTCPLPYIANVVIGGAAMTGQNASKLYYSFCLDQAVPRNNLVRRLAAAVDFGFVYGPRPWEGGCTSPRFTSSLWPWWPAVAVGPPLDSSRRRRPRRPS